MFPEAPKKIAEYIKFLIEKPLRNEILKREGNDLAKISENTGIKCEMKNVNRLNVQKLHFSAGRFENLRSQI